MYKRTLFFHLCALMASVSSGFAPIRGTTMPISTTTTAGGGAFNNKEMMTAAPPRTSKTSLSANEIDADLIVGFVTIAAACTPYALGTIFPTFFNDGFFLPVYKADDTGRVAEIGWKVRYATLGLALTTLAFLEVYIFPADSAERVLRDSYILWAIFYAEATRKIRAEATSDPPILANPSGRLGIQVWHIFVTVVLWASLTDSLTGKAITNFLINVFT